MTENVGEGESGGPAFIPKAPDLSNSKSFSIHLYRSIGDVSLVANLRFATRSGIGTPAATSSTVAHDIVRTRAPS